ncbi:protein translocase subunit SecDF [Rhodospirillum rubrum]|uniref:protein translocase subunit SecD n=1 Tax=Rhodospirillum rubrum TaxID=1085 RepID=UPI0019041D5A|nr:protein translocase subunit SecD [Rhodospirillum rubrum]MBK1663276.1 protein translocase subunit SecDF [Rhodospirillum rubrum]MBK1677068.1 protein translocase subunit SecDF [Rhodospirillum rubrum]
MLYFSKAKTIAIIAVCLIGLLLALPNAFKHGSLPDWLPQNRITLGLDLQGGSHLLLAVDMPAVIHDRLETMLESVRTNLRKESLRYTGLALRDRSVVFTLASADDIETARGALAPLVRPDEPGKPADYGLTFDGLTGRIALADSGVQAWADKAAQQSIEIVRRRIDETGVNEPMIARQGADRILVQLPGVSDPGRIKRLLGQTAKMTFHMVGDRALGDGSVPAGYRLLPSADPARPGEKILVSRKIEVDGSHLTDAKPSFDQQNGQWVVSFSFDGQGARRFAEVTKMAVGKPFAIVLDDKVVSAPVIREPITGGRGQISGSFTAASANDLAVLLRAGALPAPLTVVEERTVGPDLGADSIRAGMIAISVGFVLVVAYMGIFYGLFGWFANVALVFNLAITLGALSLMQATLTLPGIAGLLLSLGMAVDANILINERIREEAKKGRGVAASMETGFKRAFATIFDSNITTLIKMAILFSIGVGTIRGFAVTISLGIIVSMFTAITVTRLLMVVWFRRTKPKSLPMVNHFRLVPDHTKIAFMRGRLLGLGGSVVLSVASVVLFFHPGLNYGVDFAGGTVMEVRSENAVDFPALRADLQSLPIGPVQLQAFGSPNDVLIRLERQEGGDAAQAEVVKQVQAMLERDYAGSEIRRVDSVGASVSAELFQDGMMALGLAAIAMLIYIWFRFEWQFGVGAVVTMLLDVTKTVGFFAITGMQFNLTAIAAILTIMGYSINDKVVVYDRVRENLRLYRTMPLRQLIDKSINETLGRTVGTSLATFLAIIPLAVFGGEALREFALVLMFGVVLATSSSVFIAAPLLLLLGEHRLRPGLSAKALAKVEGETDDTGEAPTPAR